MWSDLILAHGQSKQIYQVSLGELYDSPLCHNAKIKRRLALDDIRQVCEWMQKNQFAEFTSESRDKIFIFWRPIQEVASAIHAWADSNARIGSVETIIDLTDDPSTRKEIFHKMPIEVVLKACVALQEVGKAQVFYSDSTDTHGVKFFNI